MSPAYRSTEDGVDPAPPVEDPEDGAIAPDDDPAPVSQEHAPDPEGDSDSRCRSPDRRSSSRRSSSRRYKPLFQPLTERRAPSSGVLSS